MRVTMKHLLLIAAAVAAGACQDDQKEIVAPGNGDMGTIYESGRAHHVPGQ